MKTGSRTPCLLHLKYESETPLVIYFTGFKMNGLEKTVCSICGEDFKGNTHAFAWHIRRHKITPKIYYDTYIESNTVHICKHKSCSNTVEFLSLQRGYRDYCSSKCSNSSAEVKEKQKFGCFSKYGYEHALQSPELLGKSRATCFKNYGVENPQNDGRVREKSKATCLEKYGVDSPNKSDIVKKKKAESCLEKYGVENPSQVAEVHSKKLKTSFKKKEYEMPSGRIYNVQGYEPYFINELLEKYNEDDIVIDDNETPEIWYMFGDKKRKYYPDIYVKSINTIFEVKSDYTYNVDLPKNLAKQLGSIEAGYNFKFIVYDGKMNRLDVF